MTERAARQVSIHAFRGEGDAVGVVAPHTVLTFQSTPSGGKATGALSAPPFLLYRVSIHAFRGEGDARPSRVTKSRLAVSIHAFRGEGDPEGVRCILKGCEFQSTPSGGKATDSSYEIFVTGAVSIHAFRGEGDNTLLRKMRLIETFQSTPSGGKATGVTANTYPHWSLFQSTPSGGKATEAAEAGFDQELFQSTPSGGKATFAAFGEIAPSPRFNPRLPGGRRPCPHPL